MRCVYLECCHQLNDQNEYFLTKDQCEEHNQLSDLLSPRQYIPGPVVPDSPAQTLQQLQYPTGKFWFFRMKAIW